MSSQEAHSSCSSVFADATALVEEQKKCNQDKRNYFQHKDSSDCQLRTKSKEVGLQLQAQTGRPSNECLLRTRSEELQVGLSGHQDQKESHSFGFQVRKWPDPWELLRVLQEKKDSYESQLQKQFGVKLDDLCAQKCFCKKRLAIEEMKYDVTKGLFEKLKTELGEVKRERDEMKALVKLELDQVKHELDEVKRARDKVDHELEKMKREDDEVKRGLDRLKRERDEVKDDRDGVKLELDKVVHELNEVKRERDGLKRKHEASEYQLAERRARVKELQKKLDWQKTSNKSRQGDLRKKHQKELEQVKNQVENFQGRQKELDAKECELVQRRCSFDKKERELVQRGGLLDKRERDLLESGYSLDKKDESLKAREKQTMSTEDRLAREEIELKNLAEKLRLDGERIAEREEDICRERERLEARAAEIEKKEEDKGFGAPKLAEVPTLSDETKETCDRLPIRDGFGEGCDPKQLLEMVVVLRERLAESESNLHEARIENDNYSKRVEEIKRIIECGLEMGENRSQDSERHTDGRDHGVRSIEEDGSSLEMDWDRSSKASDSQPHHPLSRPEPAGDEKHEVPPDQHRITHGEQNPHDRKLSPGCAPRECCLPPEGLLRGLPPSAMYPFSPMNTEIRPRTGPPPSFRRPPPHAGPIRRPPPPPYIPGMPGFWNRLPPPPPNGRPRHFTGRQCY